MGMRSLRILNQKMNKSEFELELKKKSESVDLYLHQYFEALQTNIGPVEELRQSIMYSANSGGKRFRPVLSLIIGEIYQTARARLLPFACALEMVHTYSLIHDDLPCMDNDTLRRGKPTNHIVYGDAVALLAGDSLLTESFTLIADAYKSEPALGIRLTQLLSLAAGMRGMIAGQAMDMKMPKILQVEDLVLLHQLKTGRLIRTAIEGAAEISRISTVEMTSLINLGELMGLAFQVADDLLDSDNEKDQGKSFISLLGKEGTLIYLKQLTQNCIDILKTISGDKTMLQLLIQFNLERQH